jgi:hypothetical protein
MLDWLVSTHPEKKKHLQASITANHVSIIMKEVTDTSRHGVVLPLGLRRGLRFLAAPLVVAIAAHRHPAGVVVDERSHRPDASLLDAAEVRLYPGGQHARTQRFAGRHVGTGRISDDLGEAGGGLGCLEELRRRRQRGEAEILKTIFVIFERRYVMLLASRVLFQNVTQDGRR